MNSKIIVLLSTIILIIGSYLLGKCQPDKNEIEEHNKAIALLQSQIVAGDLKLKAFSDSANKKIIVLTSKNNKLVTDNATLKQKTATLEGALSSNTHITDSLFNILPPLPDTCKQAVELALQFRSQVQLAQIIIQNKDSIIKNDSSIIKNDSLKYELLDSKFIRQGIFLDSLERSIKNIKPISNPNKLWIFPLPDRKTSFLIGLAVGVGITWYTYDRIK